MKISYSILTHNEDDSLQKLLEFLVKHKDEEDEIVILDDYSDNPKTTEILDVMTSMHEMTFEQRHLLKDYAGQKNQLTSMCKGDYIINIDADEVPNKWLVRNIRWKNPVHEVLIGYKEHTFLPQEEEFCFYHHKEIERQEKQNEFYSTI